jgi:RIO-like serine/threonine protein kinase
MRKGLLKFYGRLTLGNEARAYERLAGIPGIPACPGLKTRDILEIEYIQGSPLSRLKPGSVDECVFERLARLLQAMHSRGVANGDVHRANILVTPGNEVYLIDFAHAWISRDPSRPGVLTRFFMDLDRHACARMKARYLRLSRPAPRGLFGFFYTAGSVLKKTIRQIKKTVFG